MRLRDRIESIGKYLRRTIALSTTRSAVNRAPVVCRRSFEWSMGYSFPCLLTDDKFCGQWAFLTLHSSEGLSSVGTVSLASPRDLPDQVQSLLNFNDGSSSEHSVTSTTPYTRRTSDLKACAAWLTLICQSYTSLRSFTARGTSENVDAIVDRCHLYWRKTLRRRSRWEHFIFYARAETWLLRFSPGLL